MWVYSRSSITEASELAQGPVCKSLPHCLTASAPHLQSLVAADDMACKTKKYLLSGPSQKSLSTLLYSPPQIYVFTLFTNTTLSYVASE